MSLRKRRDIRWSWLALGLAMMGLVGCTPSDPIEELISHLRSDFGNRREQACKRLGSLGAEAVKAVPALRKILRTDRSDYVRRCAAEALGKMAPVGTAAFPELVRAFKDRAGGVRMAAAESLGHYKEKALPLLKKLIHGKDGYLQLYALRALKHVGPSGLPLLAHATKSRYLQVLQTASETLIDIGRKSFSPPKTAEQRKLHPMYFKTLLEALKVRNDKIRRHVSWALSELGPHGVKASVALSEQLLKALDHVLESAPNQVKMYAAYALRKLGKKGTEDKVVAHHLRATKSWPKVMDRLLALRNDHTWYIRKHAFSALGWLLQALRPKDIKSPQARQYRQYAARAFAAMKAALDDPTWDVRYEVTRVLRRTGGTNAFKAFLKGLRSPNPERREHSAQTLGWMGKQFSADKTQYGLLVSQVVPALETALADRSDEVKKAAQTALISIGKAAAEYLLQRHAQGSAALRIRRYRILQQLGSKAQKLPEGLLSSLSGWAEKADATPRLQLYGWYALRALKPTSASICKMMQAQSQQASGAAQHGALALLARCPSTPALRKQLWLVAQTTKDGQSRSRALLALAVLAMSHKGKRPAMTKAQRKQLASWGVAKTAAQKSAHIAAMSELSLAAAKGPTLSWLVLLKQALASPQKQVRLAAITALARWPLSLQLAPLLHKAASDPAHEVRRKGIAALGQPFPLKGRSHGQMQRGWQQTSTKLLPLLLKQLRHRDKDTRKAAILALEKLPLVYSLEIVPGLLKAAKDPAPAVRAQALHGLAWQIPLLRQQGWSIPYLQAALKAAQPPLSLKQIRRQGKRPKKQRSAAIATLRKRFPQIKPATTAALIQRAEKAIVASFGDRSAQVRKYAVFAIGNIGKYMPFKEKGALLKHLLQALKGRQKPQLKRNVCWVLGRWIAPKHIDEIVDAMRKVQLDPNVPKTTRGECEAATHQLKSDDKPYILWVNHPRSPTLETFSPDNLYPQGP